MFSIFRFFQIEKKATHTRHVLVNAAYGEVSAFPPWLASTNGLFDVVWCLPNEVSLGKKMKRETCTSPENTISEVVLFVRGGALLRPQLLFPHSAALPIPINTLFRTVCEKTPSRSHSCSKFLLPMTSPLDLESNTSSFGVMLMTLN